MTSLYSTRSSLIKLTGSVALITALFGNDTAMAAARDALAEGYLGLYRADAFQAVDGKCGDCKAPKQALWYFEGDTVAVPRGKIVSFVLAGDASVREDVAAWAKAYPLDQRPEPFMLWLGANELAEQVSLEASGTVAAFAENDRLLFRVVDKIPTNLSYYNQSSVQFFSKRKVRLRGSTKALADGRKEFVARMVWPEDFRVNAGALPLKPLTGNENLTELLRADNGGAKAEFSTRVLWEKTPGAKRDWDKKAVLGIMLNGAQGDDDEAHGGHFAIVTGWHRNDGQWADWMVNNFYNLNNFSEKGIVASMLPMDNYLMDLNSGQSYYRPSYMVVAVLREPNAAYQYQTAIQRVYNRFYRHHFEYDHANANCAGISVDTLAGMGWNTPELGATSYTKAGLGYFYSAYTDRSFTSGKRSFNYMLAERSRLYPRAAFETLGTDLFDIVSGKRAATTAYEQALKNDVQAIVFVRIPQVPSSRAFGTFPVATFDEYMARVPEDRKDWKIVPVDPRPFPDGLRDRPRKEALMSDNAVGLVASTGVGATLAAPFLWWRARRRALRRKSNNVIA